jgi:hypothetical protein
MATPLYVPVLVLFTEAVRVQGRAPNALDANLKLEISCPSTNLPGYYQSLQRSWVIPVREDGLLQLELLPSKYLCAPRTYRVKLYRLGNSTPEFTQEWEVPPVYKYQTLELVRSSLPYDELPVEVFAGVEIPGYEGWEIQPRQLIWHGGSPGVGQAYSLHYLLPLNLGDVVKRE